MKISAETEKRIDLLFPPAVREQVRSLLIEKCGENLPFAKGKEEGFYDRIRFAVLKLSDGDLEKLRRAVRLANEDWRDLLIASGFADDPKLHYLWLPERGW